MHGVRRGHGRIGPSLPYGPRPCEHRYAPSEAPMVAESRHPHRNRQRYRSDHALPLRGLRPRPRPASHGYHPLSSVCAGRSTAPAEIRRGVLQTPRPDSADRVHRSLPRDYVRVPLPDGLRIPGLPRLPFSDHRRLRPRRLGLPGTTRAPRAVHYLHLPNTHRFRSCKRDPGERPSPSRNAQKRTGWHQ